MVVSSEASDNDEPGETQDAGSQRLDKWLWFARVIKTRTQAAGLVTDGKVRVNRQRIDKPSQALRPGDVVTVTVRGRVRVLKVLRPGIRRGPPAEAGTLFEDVAAKVAPPVAALGLVGSAAGIRAPGQGRPTKRERRDIDRLKGGSD